MAVYTPVAKEILSSFLENYNIGSLDKFKGVLEGVENTNYKVITSQDTFILTIFEKRVKEQELPFFIELQNYLSKKNIKCPSPISNKNGQYINTIEDKPCVLMSFLEGKKINNATSYHCRQIGELVANTLDVNKIIQTPIKFFVCFNIIFLLKMSSVGSSTINNSSLYWLLIKLTINN